MLMICEKDILAKNDPDVRWRYVSKGWFINDCIQNKANFSELRSKLESDMLFHFEQVGGINALNESSGEVTESDSSDSWSDEYKVGEEQKIQKGQFMSIVQEVDEENNTPQTTVKYLDLKKQ